jgi:hypothetical protein
MPPLPSKHCCGMGLGQTQSTERWRSLLSFLIRY